MPAYISEIDCAAKLIRKSCWAAHEFTELWGGWQWVIRIKLKLAKVESACDNNERVDVDMNEYFIATKFIGRSMGKIIDSRHRAEKSFDNSKCNQSFLQCVSLTDCHEKRKYAERLSPKGCNRIEEARIYETGRNQDTLSDWASANIRAHAPLNLFSRSFGLFINDSLSKSHRRPSDHCAPQGKPKVSPTFLPKTPRVDANRDPSSDSRRRRTRSEEKSNKTAEGLAGNICLVSQIYFFFHLKIVTCVSFHYLRNTKSIQKQLTISPRHFDRTDSLY